MTTEQKIDRLMARVARLKAQAQTQVDAGFVQTSTQRVWGYMVGRAAPTTDQAPAQTYYSYFTSSVSKVFTATKTAAVSTGSATKSVVVRAGAIAKQAVMGAGAIAKQAAMGAGAIVKQAATAVFWTAPNWAWRQVLRGGAAVADAVWFAAEVVGEVVYTIFSILVLGAIVVAVGSVVVAALTTTIGIAVVLGMLWVGMLNHLLNEDAHQATRRNAARPC